MSTPQPATFSNYLERLQYESLECIAFRDIGGGKDTLTGVEISTIYGLANLVADCGAFDPMESTAGQYRYIGPPRLVSGALDVASRRNPVRDQGKETPSQVVTPTNLGVERKLYISLRDWFVLFYLLQVVGIEITVENNEVKVHVGMLYKNLLSSAMILILAQLAQDMHANKAEYITLATHDVYMLVRLVGSNVVECSQPLFRDPSLYHPFLRNRVWLNDLLQNVRQPHRDNIIDMVLQYSWSTVSVEVLVAGLVVPLAEDMNGKWVNLQEPAPLEQHSEELPSTMGGNPTAGGSSAVRGGPLTRQSAASRQGTNTNTSAAGFNVRVAPSAKDKLSENNLALEPRHYLPIADLPQYSWHVHPAFRLAPTTPSAPSSDAPSLSDPVMTATTHSLPSPAAGISTFHEPFLDTAEGEATSQISPVFIDYPLRRPCASSDEETLQHSKKHRMIGDSSRAQANVIDISPKLADSSSKNIGDSVHTLGYVGHGQLWDTYYGVRVTSEAEKAVEEAVVIKLCNPLDYEVISKDETRAYSRAQAEQHIYNEVDLLCTHAKALEGVAPRILSAYEGEHIFSLSAKRYRSRLFAIVMEDCGKPWPFFANDDWEPVIPNLTPQEQDDIIAVYDRLHKTGILHNDLWPGHITKHPVDGAPRILDFEGAKYFGPVERERHAADFQEEMWRVLRMIDKDDEDE
ncbi:hypothetical protein IAR50_007263 [Cryptococcus sp. DSM 104548]